MAHHALAAGDQGVAVLGRIVEAAGGARLHLAIDDPLVGQVVLDHQRGVGEAALDRLGIAVVRPQADIARRALPQLRCGSVERVRHRHHGRQHLVVDLDRLGGVARLIERLRHDQRHRLAHIAHALAREHRLGLLEHEMIGAAAEGGLLRLDRVGRIGEMGDALVAVGRVVGGGQDRQHAGTRARRLVPDRGRCAHARAASAAHRRSTRRAAECRWYSGRGR